MGPGREESGCEGIPISHHMGEWVGWDWGDLRLKPGCYCSPVVLGEQGAPQGNWLGVKESWLEVGVRFLLLAPAVSPLYVPLTSGLGTVMSSPCPAPGSRHQAVSTPQESLEQPQHKPSPVYGLQSALLHAQSRQMPTGI